MKKIFYASVIILLLAAGCSTDQNTPPPPMEHPSMERAGQQTTVQPTPTAAPTPSKPSPTPTPSPTSTSGWKTYKNDKYGFSFDYPGYFTKRGDESYFLLNLGTDNGSDYLTVIRTILSGDNSVAAGLSPTRLSAVCGYSKTFKQWVPENNGTTLTDCPQKMALNQSADMYTIQAENYTVSVDIPTPDQSAMLMFSMGQNFSCSGCLHNVTRSDWEKVLSSFRFFIPAQQASWETYSVDRLGVSFSYPSDFHIENYYGGDTTPYIVRNNDKVKIELKDDDISSYNNFQEYAEKTAMANCDYASDKVSISCPALSQPTSIVQYNGIDVYKIYLNRVTLPIFGPPQNMLVGPIYAFDLSQTNNSKLTAVFVNMDGFFKDDATLNGIVSSFKFNNN